LTEGPHTLYVQERGADSNNWSSSGSYTVVVDLTKPYATLNSGSAAEVNQNIQVSVVLSEASRGLPEAALQLVNASVQQFAYANSLYTFTLQPTAEGDFSVGIPQDRFQDLAGNFNTVSNTITRRFDHTPPPAPVITTDGGFGSGHNFLTNASTVRLEGTVLAGVARVLVNGSAAGVAFILGAETWRYDGALASGANTFEVTCEDVAGNRSAAASITVTSLSVQDVYVSPTGDDTSEVGSAAAPWRTVGHAMDFVRGYSGGDRFVNIHLAAGTYAERVVMEPLTALVGDPAAQRSDVRIAPVKDQLLATDSAYALSAAQDTRLENLSLELPLDAPPSSEVLRIHHVRCMATNIAVNGRDVSGSVGVSILGADSSETEVSMSQIERADYGLRAVETSANITHNVFRDIRFDAVFVRGPATKTVGSSPILGDVSRAGTTGDNQFSNVSGFFVRNMNTETVMAQMNSWGFETEQEIAAKMSGPVTFVPFIKGGTDAASLVCTVRDEYTSAVVLNAAVYLDGAAPVTDNVNGVYTLSDLAPGFHTVVVTAPGYNLTAKSVTLTAGGVTELAIALNKDAGYTLTYAAGAHGAISGITPQAVKAGGTGATVTAVADNGYHFAQWSDGGLMATRTDRNVVADISVTASFTLNTYALVYTPGPHGFISGTTPQAVNYGESGAPVTAVAEGGYHFVQWSDGVSTATRTDTNVRGNVSVTASFALNTYTLAYTAGEHGTISGISPQTVDHGGNGSAVTAMAADGYHFVQWSDGVSTAARTDTNVLGNVSVTAAFAINIYTLTYTAGANGFISGASPQTVNHGGNGSAVTAVAQTGYHFEQWSDGVLTAARTDSLVTGNISVTAVFASNTYTLTYTAGANGSISGSSPQTVNHGGTGSPVTAVADNGYRFAQWSDGLLAATRTDSNVTADISVTAVFGVATAEGETEGEILPPGTIEEIAQRFIDGFAAADTDHNGGLSWAEALAAFPWLTRTVFDEMDANGNGEITLDELNQIVNPGGCNCNCKKSNLTIDGFKGRLADLFLAGLALTSLLAVRGRRF
jgi:hypothetical protein